MAVAAAAWLTGPLGAGAQQGADVDRDKAPPGKGPTLEVKRASELIGKEVRNPQWENLGKIEDLVADVPDGRIAYAVLSFGGILGIHDKLFAIPFESLTLRSKDQKEQKIFVLDVDKEQLKTAPGFDKNAWPDMADQKWGSEVHTYYHRKPYWETRDADVAERNEKFTAEVKRVRKIKGELIGKDVKEPGGKDIGDIKDIMVDMNSGRLPFAIVTFNDTARVPRETTDRGKALLYALPWNALRLARDPEGGKDVFLLDVPLDRLQNAPRFAEDKWPDFSDTAYAGEVYSFYNVRAYWTRERTTDR
jgi:sporulation protein YlmC with PRC-barrel domain